MLCVLVSCCGLPAAGKTTFCRSIVADASTSTSAGTSFGGAPVQVRVSHVCFDEHIDRARLRCEPRSSDDNKPDPYSNPVGPLHSGHAGRGMQDHREDRGKGESEKERSRSGERDSSAERDYKNGLRALSPVSRNEDSDEKDTTQGVVERHRDGDGTHAIDTQPATEPARAPLDYGDSKGSEHGLKWWHEGRRAAMAEVEVLTAAPQMKGESPATTASGSESPSRGGVPRSSARSPAAAVPVTKVDPGERVVDNEEVSKHPAGGSVTPGEGLSRSGASSAIHVVLADDNMHFRSMRREVWCLARKLVCGYAQVYFPTDVNVAVERDKMRRTPVTEAVVRKMAANIQPPDPERFKWEQHTTVVESPASPYPQGRLATSNGDGSNQIPGRCNSDTRAPCPKRGDLGAKDGATDDATGGNPRRSFWRAIAAAAAEDLTPLPSPASSAASLLEQEADRVATRASWLHQLDLELREAVKRVAKAAASAGLTRDVHQQVMSACTASRKIAIRGARQGGTQSRAGLPHQHTAGGTATSKYRDGGVREGVQDDAESVCDIAKVVRARCPLVSCPSHVERFIREFGKALCNIDGLDVPSREVLVAVVRSSGGTI